MWSELDTSGRGPVNAKRCPACGTIAPISEAICAGCRRVYRTRHAQAHSFPAAPRRRPKAILWGIAGGLLISLAAACRLAHSASPETITAAPTLAAAAQFVTNGMMLTQTESALGRPSRVIAPSGVMTVEYDYPDGRLLGSVQSGQQDGYGHDGPHIYTWVKQDAIGGSRLVCPIDAPCGWNPIGAE